MSQNEAIIRQTTVPVLRCTADMDLDTLIAFVDGDMTVAIQQGVIRLYEDGPFSDSYVQLEEDDMLVRVFNDIEVFSPEEFAEHFA